MWRHMHEYFACVLLHPNSQFTVAHLTSWPQLCRVAPLASLSVAPGNCHLVPCAGICHRNLPRQSSCSSPFSRRFFRAVASGQSRRWCFSCKKKKTHVTQISGDAGATQKLETRGAQTGTPPPPVLAGTNLY